MENWVLILYLTKMINIDTQCHVPKENKYYTRSYWKQITTLCTLNRCINSGLRSLLFLYPPNIITKHYDT